MRYFVASFPESARSLVDAVERVLRRIDGVFLVGGIPEPARVVLYLRSTGLRVYGVTSSLDDHYVARILEEHGALAEGEVKALEEGLLVAGINGRDPATSITQIEGKLEGLEGKTILLGYHAPQGCGDRIPGLQKRVGLRELRAFLERVKPLLYITSRSPVLETCRIGSTLVVSTGWLKNGDYTIVELPSLFLEHRKIEGKTSPKHFELATSSRELFKTGSPSLFAGESSSNSLI